MLMSIGLLRNTKVLLTECLHQDPPALMAVTLSWEIRRADIAAEAAIERPAQALHQADPYTKAHEVKKYSSVC